LNRIIRTSDRSSYRIKMRDIFPLYRFIPKDLKPKFDNFVKENKENYNDEDLIAMAEHDVSLSKIKSKLQKKFLKVFSESPRIGKANIGTYIENRDFAELYKLYINGKIKLSKMLNLIKSY